MLASELGPDWRSKFGEFDDNPFAAASIGEVHIAKLKDGRPVAVKIQYPGVAKGIESDIDNLVGILSVWNIIPKGYVSFSYFISLRVYVTCYVTLCHLYF